MTKLGSVGHVINWFRFVDSFIEGIFLKDNVVTGLNIIIYFKYVIYL